MNNNQNAPTKEQQEFVAFLRKKYGDKLDEKKLKELKDSGQLQKDVQEFQNSKKKKAAHGTKLNYLRTISHKCPEGEELYYFKSGGKALCGCKKKDGGEIEKNQDGGTVVDKFKDRIKDTTNKIGKTVASTAKKVANKEKEKAAAWSKEYKRTTKASGIGNKGWVEWDKCGKKIKKNSFGNKVDVVSKFKMKCGAKMKKHFFGGNL